MHIRFQQNKQKICQKYDSIDILKILLEFQRLVAPFDPEAFIDDELNGDSSVQDWMDAGDLLPWYKLYHVLNKKFNLRVSEEQWKEVLVPSKKLKLFGVANLISSHIHREDIVPLNILGNNCLEASIFKYLISNLKKYEYDLSHVTTSTTIFELLDICFSEFIHEVLLLTKGERIFNNIEVAKIEKVKTWLPFYYRKKYFYTFDNMVTLRDLINRISRLAES